MSKSKKTGGILPISTRIAMGQVVRKDKLTEKEVARINRTNEKHNAELLANRVTYPIGMDVVSYAFERSAAQSLGRQNLPRDPQALRARLGEIGQMIARMLSEPRALEDMQGFMFRFSPGTVDYDLPGVIERTETAFRVKRAGLRLVSQGGRHGLIREGARQAVEVPATMQPQLAWVLERDRFAKSELASAFPDEGPDKLDRLIADLSRMALLEPA